MSNERKEKTGKTAKTDNPARALPIKKNLSIDFESDGQRQGEMSDEAPVERNHDDEGLASDVIMDTNQPDQKFKRVKGLVRKAKSLAKTIIVNDLQKYKKI